MLANPCTVQFARGSDASGRLMTKAKENNTKNQTTRPHTTHTTATAKAGRRRRREHRGGLDPGSSGTRGPPTRSAAVMMQWGSDWHRLKAIEGKSAAISAQLQRDGAYGAGAGAPGRY